MPRVKKLLTRGLPKSRAGITVRFVASEKVIGIRGLHLGVVGVKGGGRSLFEGLGR
jgi:hypothetical protein